VDACEVHLLRERKCFWPIASTDHPSAKHSLAQGAMRPFGHLCMHCRLARLMRHNELRKAAFRALSRASHEIWADSQGFSRTGPSTGTLVHTQGSLPRRAPSAHFPASHHRVRLWVTGGHHVDALGTSLVPPDTCRSCALPKFSALCQDLKCSRGRTGSSLLDSPQRVSQIARVHRGARQVLAENIPVEPAWVMPAKGGLDVQDRRPAVPVARGERSRVVFSPASTVGLVARIRGR
jgi:hypothetical protein